MTELPPGLLLRRPSQDEIQVVVDLLNACSTADIGYPDSTREDLTADWSLPRFDLSRDAWLVESSEKKLVGYAWLWDKKPHVDVHGDLYVLPAHRGRAIETVLLERIEERAREHVPAAPPDEPVEIGMFAPVDDARMGALFRARGYERIRTFFRMRIDLAAGFPAPVWPAGIVARPYRPGVDEHAAYTVLEESFADHFRFVLEPQDEWVTRRVGYGNFDPALWLIAWDSDEPAGAILTYDFPDLGWVRELGVRSAWRGRGIGKALLLESFRALSERGQGRVCLGVDAENATGATNLYEGVGMRVEQAHDLYQLRIRPVAPAPSGR